MSDDRAVNRQVGEFFGRHIRSRSNVDDIKGLDLPLSEDPALLRGLASRCFEESRREMHAGNHIEGRRLDILGRQLGKRADDVERRKRD